jgi:hypothetical protein
METIGPAYGAALRSVVPDLVAQLEAVAAAREVDRGPEPEPDLSVPRADGPLAALEPPPIG